MTATRWFVPFGALWAMPIEIPYSALVRDGDLAWSCGQVPLDADSRVVAPDDLVAQTEVVCGYVEETLRLGGLSGDAVGKLVLYYVARDHGDRDRMMAVCRARFGDQPVLVPIAVPHFYYDGLLLEADVFATARRGARIEKSTDRARVSIVDGGELAWAGVTVAVDHLAEGATLLEAALHELGLGTGERISEHWAAPLSDPGGAPLGTTAKTLCEMMLLSDEGALLRGAEGQGGLVGALTYARGRPEPAAVASNEVSGVRIVTRKKGRFDWLGARCLDGGLGLVEQTARIMAVIEQTLTALGIGFNDVVKSTSHYVAGGSPGELHDNMAVRNRYYETPGPASTGLPVFALADGNSRIAVDILAARSGE